MLGSWGDQSMNSREHYLRMLAYDRWANRETALALRNSGMAESKAARLMAHIVSAEKLWLERIKRVSQTMPVWPASTIEECIALAESVADSWQSYLKRVSPEGFNEEIEYRNSKGELWSSCVEDVLNHVFFHSAYHRGQIALQMRAEGFEPTYTDFIHAVRKGFIK